MGEKMKQSVWLFLLILSTEFMAKKFSEYTEQFFWDFKRMDNVNYNFEIIELLYKAKKENNNSTHFNKPIIIHLMAIIECILYDFENRVRGFSTDSFPSITTEEVAHLKAKKETDELRKLIPRFQSLNLLRVPESSSLYSDLEQLRKVRNRIHIQNNYKTLPRTEVYAFKDEILKKTEICFEEVCKVFCNVYPRWGKTPMPMEEFPRPWTL